MNDSPMEMKKHFVPRIMQLDANEFNNEIHNVLSAQLFEVKKFLNPGTLTCIKSEMDLLLNLLFFQYSVIRKNATFGQELLNLKYKDPLSKMQVITFALLNYIFPYFQKKCEQNSSRIEGSLVQTLVKKLEIFVKLSNFLNLLIFLKEGKYPTVVDRLLKLKHFSVNQLSRTVGYNYMVRELLWHGFLELLMYVLPLINYKAIKRKIKAAVFSKSKQTRTKKNVILHVGAKCVICEDCPIIPCQISSYCPHLTCYYCIKSNIVADEKFMCPVCNETNTAHQNFKFLQGTF